MSTDDVGGMPVRLEGVEDNILALNEDHAPGCIGECEGEELPNPRGEVAGSLAGIVPFL